MDCTTWSLKKLFVCVSGSVLKNHQWPSWGLCVVEFTESSHMHIFTTGPCLMNMRWAVRPLCILDKVLSIVFYMTMFSFVIILIYARKSAEINLSLDTRDRIVFPLKVASHQTFLKILIKTDRVSGLLASLVPFSSYWGLFFPIILIFVRC